MTLAGRLAAVGRLAATGFLLVGVVSCSQSGDAVRWSALPRSMGCQFRADDRAVDPPGSALVEQVTLSHPGGQLLRLDVDFVGGVPAKPRVVNGPYGPTEAPGSVLTDFLIEPAHAPGKAIAVSSPSPSVGWDWSGDISEWDASDPEVLQSVAIDGDVLTLVLDLSGHDDVLGEGVFEADVDVVQMVQGGPGANGISEPFAVRSPECLWDTAPLTSETSKPSDPTQVPSHRPPAPSQQSVPAGVPGTDARGFVGYPGAQCDDLGQVMLAARTTLSVLVICGTDGDLTYRGSRLSDGASILLTDVVTAPGGFDIDNSTDGTAYQVRSTELTIRTAGQVFVEPVVDFWARAREAIPPVAPNNPTTSAARYVRTVSGQVRCVIDRAQVACERTSAEGFPQAPQDSSGEGHWNLATVTSDGQFHWAQGNIGGADINSDVVLEYGQTNRFDGWTISSASGGTRFSNDATAHGMFVSTQLIESF